MKKEKRIRANGSPATVNKQTKITGQKSNVRLHKVTLPPVAVTLIDRVRGEESLDDFVLQAVLDDLERKGVGKAAARSASFTRSVAPTGNGSDAEYYAAAQELVDLEIFNRASALLNHVEAQLKREDIKPERKRTLRVIYGAGQTVVDQLVLPGSLKCLQSRLLAGNGAKEGASR